MTHRLRKWLLRARAWRGSAFPSYRIGARMVLALLVAPPLFWPLLHEGDIVGPVAVVLWLFVSGGLTGAFLLDVARRRIQPGPRRERLLQLAARAPVVSLGAAGSVAGVAILIRVGNIQSIPGASRGELAVVVLVAASVLANGVALVYKAFQQASE